MEFVRLSRNDSRTISHESINRLLEKGSRLINGSEPSGFREDDRAPGIELPVPGKTKKLCDGECQNLGVEDGRFPVTETIYTCIAACSIFRRGRWRNLGISQIRVEMRQIRCRVGAGEHSRAAGEHSKGKGDAAVGVKDDGNRSHLASQQARMFNLSHSSSMSQLSSSLKPNRFTHVGNSLRSTIVFDNRWTIVRLNYYFMFSSVSRSAPSPYKLETR